MKNGILTEGSSFLSSVEIKYFDRMYDEKLMDRGTGENILFNDMRDIIMNCNKPEKTIISENLEKIRKKKKEGGGISDSELFISITLLTFFRQG